MMIEDDEALLEDGDELTNYSDPMENLLINHVDARRRIERRQELKRLREMSGDPDLDDSFD